MFKGKLILTITLLFTCLVNAQNRDRFAVFVGYDGQIPILAVELLDNGIPLYIQDSIYKYANGRLTNINIPIPEASLCISVKNDIYAFSDTLNGLNRFQFKRNGKDLISQFTLKWNGNVSANYVTMNDEYFFVNNGCYNGKGIILRTKYRDPTEIDTINIGFCSNTMLDASSEYLYFTELIDGFAMGNVYQINHKNGNVKMIAKKVNCDEFGIAIVPHLSLIFSGNIKYPILMEYNKKQSIQSPDATSSGGIFFSYEHNAFVNYKSTLDISKWECFYLGEGGKLPTELRGVPCFAKK